MKATAIVRVEVEVTMTQPWGDECTLGQVYTQARSQAIELVRQGTSLRIIGEPKVRTVMTEADDG